MVPELMGITVALTEVSIKSGHLSRLSNDLTIHVLQETTIRVRANVAYTPPAYSFKVYKILGVYQLYNYRVTTAYKYAADRRSHFIFQLSDLKEKVTTTHLDITSLGQFVNQELLLKSRD